MYIMKEEIRDMGYGKTKIYNVYFVHKNGETFDSCFGIREKAEKYIKNMNI